MSRYQRRLALVWCVFLTCLLQPLRAQTPPPALIAFGERVDVPTGANPTRLAIADFNSDNISDIVTANFYPNTTVSVLLGNGDRTFRPHVDYEAGYVPYDVKVADFDADGKLDLAVTNREPGTVSILLGNGDGTFRPRVPYFAGSAPVTLAVADFNRDGLIDVAAGILLDSAVSVLLGNGDGTLQLPVAFNTGYYTYSIVADDFNADGKPDLAAANYLENTLSVLLGNGDGSFQPKTDYAASGTQGLVSADFNGDGTPDLAATASSTDAILVWRGLGTGTFAAPVAYPVGAAPAFMEGAADVNADGRVDLIVPTYSSNSVTILAGNGDGTFPTRTDVPVGAGPISAGVGDFDADGKADLAVTNNAGGTLTVLYGGAGDTTPPVITLQSRTTTNSAGWNRTDVVVSWTCSDVGGSGPADAVVSATVSTEGAGQSVAGTCSDLAGNTATDTQSAISIDKTAPTLHPSVNTSPILVNGSATMTAGAADTLSGIVSEGCSPLVTTSVGTKSADCTATDIAGNTTTAPTEYRVVYRFDGFLQPINDTGHSQVCGDPCPVSIFKGGSTVPVKFQLKDAGGNVIQGGLPSWVTPAKGGPTTASIDEGVYSDPASAGILYSWSGSHYKYNWSTKDISSGFYWRIGVTLDDGQTYFVYVGVR